MLSAKRKLLDHLSTLGNKKNHRKNVLEGFKSKQLFRNELVQFTLFFLTLLVCAPLMNVGCETPVL